jgi:hypothetical protein
MENELDPRELARFKKAARVARIGRIRRRVAVFGTSLVALFSGAVLVRSQIDQPQSPFPGATTTAAATTLPVATTRSPVDEPGYSGSDDDHDSDDDHGDDHGDDHHSDEQSGSISRIIQTATDTVGNVIGGAQTPSTDPAQTAPTPAPLTTSQS